MERERILNERHEKMNDVKEKVKLLKEFKKNKKMTKNETKNDALADLKERRDRRLQRNASASQEDMSESESEIIQHNDNNNDKSKSYYSSDEDMSRDMDHDQKMQRKDIGIRDLEKIRVSRSDLEKWHRELLFEETVKGCFVKINMGEAVKNNKSSYKIFQIIRLKKTTKPYKFGDGNVSKELLGRHGRETRSFQMAVVSNSKFEVNEFSEWRIAFDKNGEYLPSLDEIDDIEAQLNKIKNHSYTPQEINKIIEQNINKLIEKGSQDINVTYIKTQLEIQLQYAEKQIKDDPHCLDSKEIYNKIKANLEKLEEIKNKKKSQLTKKSEQKVSFNKRAMIKQMEEDHQRSNLLKKKQKESGKFDAFSTIR